MTVPLMRHSEALRQLALQTAAPAAPAVSTPDAEPDDLSGLAAELSNAVEDFAEQRRKLRHLQQRKQQQKELLEKASVASSNCNKAVMEAIQEAKKLLEDLCELKDLEQLLRLKERQELELRRLAQECAELEPETQDFEGEQEGQCLQRLRRQRAQLQKQLEMATANEPCALEKDRNPASGRVHVPQCA